MRFLRSHWVVTVVLAVVIAGGITGGVLGTRSSSPPKRAVSPSTTSTTVSPSTTSTTVSPSTTSTTVAPSTTSTAPAVALPHVYSVGCPANQPATFKPTEIPISCADYGVYISDITWSSWTSTGAQGSGTLYVNNCTPSCAAGTFSTYPTPVSLSDPVQTVTQGLVFATLTSTAPNGSSQSIDIGPPENCMQVISNPQYC